MERADRDNVRAVNCRIGSLEKQKFVDVTAIGVNCRIGSLEKN